MNELFTRKWFVATVVTWAVIIGLDEVAYLAWKKINPGSMWSGIIVKHPTTNYPDSTSNDYPNGYRPAGAG